MKLYNSILAATIVVASLVLAQPAPAQPVGGDSTNGYVFAGAVNTVFDTAYTYLSTDRVQGSTSQVFGGNITSWTLGYSGIIWQKALEQLFPSPDTTWIWYKKVSGTSIQPLIIIDIVRGDSIHVIGGAIAWSNSWSQIAWPISYPDSFNAIRVRLSLSEASGSAAIAIDSLVMKIGGQRVVIDLFDEPNMNLYPEAMAWGNVGINCSSLDLFAIFNYGGQAVQVDSIWSTGSEFVAQQSQAAVPPYSYTEVQVVFTPTQAGFRSAWVHARWPGGRDSIWVHGVGTQDGACGVSYFLTVPPDSLLAKRPGSSSLVRPVRRGRGLMPNWANLLEEAVVQGAFQPAATESDSAGGMVIGDSYMLRTSPTRFRVKRITSDTAWVRLSSWNMLRNKGLGYSHLRTTLEDRAGLHTGPARGLDSTLVPGAINRRALKGQKTSLKPRTASNKLFAELVAYKFNIAASQLGKTPAGLGELIYDTDGNPFDEMSLLEISATADSLMTYWRGVTQATYDSLYAALYRINRAFVRTLDTASFENPQGLKLLGVQLDTVAGFYLKLARPPVPPRRLTPTTSLTTDEESESELEDEAIDGEPTQPKLYQNYPNPFNPATTIAFRLGEPSLATLTIYNLLGQEVARLLDNEELDEGHQMVLFTGSNLASGIYFYRLSVETAGSEKFVTHGKMLLLK